MCIKDRLQTDSLSTQNYVNNLQYYNLQYRYRFTKFLYRQKCISSYEKFFGNLSVLVPRICDCRKLDSYNL